VSEVRKHVGELIRHVFLENLLLVLVRNKRIEFFSLT